MTARVNTGTCESFSQAARDGTRLRVNERSDMEIRFDRLEPKGSVGWTGFKANSKVPDHSPTIEIARCYNTTARQVISAECVFTETQGEAWNIDPVKIIDTGYTNWPKRYRYWHVLTQLFIRHVIADNFVSVNNQDSYYDDNVKALNRLKSIIIIAVMSF